MTRRARLLRANAWAGAAGAVVEVVQYPGGMFGPAGSDGEDAQGDYWCPGRAGVACIGKPGKGFEWVDAPRKLVAVSTDPDDLADYARRDALDAICTRMEKDGDVLDLLELVLALNGGHPSDLAAMKDRAAKLADEVEAEVRRQAEAGL